MFDNVTRSDDGKSLLFNGLIVQTDDVLLWADTEEEMKEILEVILRTVVARNVAIHLGKQKCEIFIKETRYCGLKIKKGSQ